MTIVYPDSESNAAIGAVLTLIPEHLLTLTANAGMRIRVLERTQAYRDVSPALRRLAAGVDDWPIPPAGLFVIEEASIYLRSLTPMTIAHETFHAVDAALGGGLYFSGIDPGIRRAFECATAFVTPYAASGLDEYFAEAGRAMIGVNDPGSIWPPVTSRRLLHVDPIMHQIMVDLFTPPIPTKESNLNDHQ
jgi:hypothetical protein